MKNVDSFDLQSFLPNKNRNINGSTKEKQPVKKANLIVPISKQLDIPAASEPAGPSQVAGRGKQPIKDADASAATPPPFKQIERIEKAHDKYLTALSIDPSAVRMITGSYDYSVKFWDFNSMDRSFRSFRTINPWEGNQIKDLQFSNNGERFLAVSNACFPKLYDREGHLLGDFQIGDMYLRDMKNTKGHVAALTCCQWHPVEDNLFLTSSFDSTVRIWNVEHYRKQDIVLVPKSIAGNRLNAAVNSACFSRDGELVFGCRMDGSISGWDWKSPYLKPMYHVADTHRPGTETSRIISSRDGKTVVTRGGDGTLKLWDLRNFKTPVNSVGNLLNSFSETDVVFSPDERYIVTGTSVERRESPGQDGGRVLCYDKQSLELVDSYDLGNESAIRLLWHPRINQIFVGTSSGALNVLYDPEQSSKGILLANTKPVKRKLDDSYYADVPQEAKIYLPNAILKEPSTIQPNRKQHKDSLKPKPPTNTVFGPGYNGVIGYTETRTMMSMMEKDDVRDQNPREALLKYAKIAEEDPKFISHVYKKTQPKPIFDMTPDDEDSKNKK